MLVTRPHFILLVDDDDDVRETSADMLEELGYRVMQATSGFEALTMGAVGWVAGLVVAFPAETVAIYRLLKAGRREEALVIYRWFRPLLDLDVSTFLVQNIKLVEAVAIGSNDRVRQPRLPHSGDRRREIEALVSAAMKSRPRLPALPVAA